MPSKKEVKEARKASTWIKWGGVASVILGVVLLIGGVFLLGAVMAKMAMFPEEVVFVLGERISWLMIILGAVFILDGVITAWYASRVEKVLQRWNAEAGTR